MKHLACLALILTSLPALAASELLVKLDAASSTPGSLPRWTNSADIGGTFTNSAATPPRVEEVAGRRAIVFGGSNWLQSDFAAPAALAGNNPFTLAVWVFNPELKPKETLVSWASRPVNSAEFSYGNGRGRSEGAFTSFGAGNTGFDGGAPAAGVWHHLAWTYAGGSNGAFRIFVDGRLTTERLYSLKTKAREPILIGAGWDARAGVPWTPFSGALAEVRIWSGELSEREVRNAAGWSDAFRPSPADGSEVEAIETTLRWQNGSTNTAKFHLYLGERESEVASATPDSHGVFKSELPIARAEWPNHPLALGKSFFWRVDQVDARGEVFKRGDVWHFRVSTGPAREPTPRDELAAARQTLAELRWQPGPFAKAQTVWFGTNRDDIAAGRGQPLAKLDGKTGRISLPRPLEFARSFFWRVATENGPQAPDPGRVWRFRSEDERRPNDFWFFVSSDTHYGFAENHKLNKQSIDLMNSAPGLALPEKLGGTVGTPRGVVLNGDLLDRGFERDATEHWAEWVRDYGLTGSDGRLAFPVYEGFGNHDGGPTKSVTRAAVRERNKRRPAVTNISTNGLHYSWDWEQLHLVQLNLFGGNGPDDIQNVSKPEHDPEGALEFLRQDLAHYVGTSGRPVMVFQHFSWIGGMSDWWTPAAKDRFHATVTNYNIAALINGHSHGASFIEWKGLQTIHDGAMARPDSGGGDFLIVHATTNELTVIQRKPDGWGISMRKPLTRPGPLKTE